MQAAPKVFADHLGAKATSSAGASWRNVTSSWAELWVADITYIPMARGFLYLVVVMDWVSCYVPAWRL